MIQSTTPQVSRTKPLFDFIKKQRENEKFAKTIEIAFTFFLVTFFLIFAIRPTVFTISSLLGDIQSKKLLKKDLRVKINNVIQAQELFSQVQERYQVINASLPDNPRYFSSAYQIQKISSDSGVNLGKLNFSFENLNSENINPNLGFYSISLDLNSRFELSSKVVSEILNNRRIANINSISFSREASASSEAFGLTSKFTTIFYYWPTVYEKK